MNDDDIWSRLAGTLQQAGGSLQQGAQSQPVSGGAYAAALQKISRALQPDDPTDPAQQYAPAPGGAPAQSPARPAYDPAAQFGNALQQISDYRNAQHQKQQQAAQPLFPAADPNASAKEWQRQTQKWEEDNARSHALSAWQRPPATPAVIQKLLAEGRITPVEAQMGQTPSFADGRMIGFVMP